MSRIFNNGSIGYIADAKVGVTFSKPIGEQASAPVAPIIKTITSKLNVFPWGEDNRFPQNIVNALSASGVAQSLLKWKSSALWGSGLVYGKVVDIDAAGNEVFQTAKLGEYPDVDRFFKENRIARFFDEFGKDFYYYANCWVELIFSNDYSKIVGIVHQESSDCRWKQMNDNGKLDTVYISKLWGATKDQYVLFDPNKSIQSNYDKNATQLEADGKFVIQKTAIDMYFPLDDLKKFAKNAKGGSCILPVTASSPGKTYYQLASWDGARVSGWIEIASKVPSLIKSLYNKAFNLRYHVEIPDNYFHKSLGKKVWESLDENGRKQHQDDLIKKIDQLLSGSENAYKSLITFFAINQVNGVDEGRVKITKLDAKNDTASDLLASGTANSEIAAAMNVNPNIMGLGKAGGVYSSNQGGSNIREGKLEHDAGLHLDRQLALEPFELIKQFNQWPDELEFRFKDTVLLTLDKGKQTETKIN